MHTYAVSVFTLQPFWKVTGDGSLKGNGVVGIYTLLFGFFLLLFFFHISVISRITGCTQEFLKRIS